MKFSLSGAIVMGLFLKILIYGHSGTGKTTWAAKAPKPLILLLEKQGAPSIRFVRDDAGVIELRTFAEFKKVLKAIQKCKTVETDTGPALVFKMKKSEFIFQTLVIDSLSQLSVEMVREMKGAKPGTRLDVRKITRSNHEKWGRVGEVMADLLDDLRDLECNLICITLAYEESDNKKQLRIKPDLVGQMRSKAQRFFSAVGYVTLGAHRQHIIAWRADARFTTKPAPGWPRITPADVTLGSLALSTTPGAPHEPTDDPAQVELAREQYPDRPVDLEDEEEADTNDKTKDDEDEDDG